MQSRFRDNGWLETEAIIRSGITTGNVLEIGPGSGYLGLEWLKHTQGTILTGLDISADMISVARRNASQYRLTGKTVYIESSASVLPFDQETFDAVFSCRSLHEWFDDPQTFAEIWRVLRPGGCMFISDLRRDIAAPVKWFMWLVTKPRVMRYRLINSINAAYTQPEITTLLSSSPFKTFNITCSPMDLQVIANK